MAWTGTACKKDVTTIYANGINNYIASTAVSVITNNEWMVGVL